MTEILKTRDYDIFKYVNGNRDIKKGPYKRLLGAIERDNQLCINPIIVNKHFEIIDGQHRLEVAKALQLDIYYIQSETVTHQFIIESNVNRKTFEVDDYIKYFCLKEKNPVYIQLKEMLINTGLKPKALLTLILGTVSSNILLFLKTGKFRFPEKDDQKPILQFYRDFINYASDKRLKPLSMFTNHNFTRALRWLFNTQGFEQMILFKKLDLRWFDLKPQRTSQDWYELLIDIYNYKNHQRLEKNEQ